MVLKEDIQKYSYKPFKEILEIICDEYCESMTDQEFNYLIEGLEEKLKIYFKNKIERF